MAHPLTGKSLQAVRHSTASINAYEGTVRSGKTVASILAWLHYLRSGPTGPLLMVGRTQRTIKQNVIDPMIEMLGEKRCRYVAGMGMLYLFDRKIYVVGANDEASVTKIQGLTLAGAYVDECATIPESFFNMLYSRLSVAGAQLWLTSNPAGPQHWLKKNWLDRAKLWIDRDGKTHHASGEDRVDAVRVSFKLEDNPHLPDDYVERTKNSYTGLFYRRYILGEWIAAEGAIYDMWDPGTHVIPWAELPPMRRLLAVGVDYGSTNPTTGLLLGLSDERDDHGRPFSRLFLVDEWRHDPQRDAVRLTDAQLSERMRAWLGADHLPNQAGLRPEYVVVDPSAASFRLQLYRDGVASTPANNDVTHGISLMSTLLGTGQLLVSDRCEGLITEVPGYAWDPKATEKGEDAPLKVADHGLDAARYCLATTESLWRPHLTNPMNMEVAA